MDKLKKSGMDMDMNIEQMDWVEDNKKVSPFILTIIFLWLHIVIDGHEQKYLLEENKRISSFMLVVY